MEHTRSTRTADFRDPACHRRRSATHCQDHVNGLGNRCSAQPRAAPLYTESTELSSAARPMRGNGFKPLAERRDPRIGPRYRSARHSGLISPNPATSATRSVDPAAPDNPLPYPLHRRLRLQQERTDLASHSSMNFIASATTLGSLGSKDQDWLQADRTRATTPGRTPSETDEHRRSTTGPQWTNLERSVTCVSAGQIPDDVARPKGFEPLTF